MKLRFMSLVALAVGAILAPVSANAGIQTVTATVGGSALSGANYVNFDTLPASGGVANGVTVSLGSGALVATLPNVDGQYAAPFASGGNNLGFGTPVYSNPVIGIQDYTRYLTTGDGGPSEYVSLDFGSEQNYFGILWGSVDDYNTLTFYNDNNAPENQVVGVITPSGNTPSVPHYFNAPNPNGLQAKDGTFYVNVIFSGGGYTRVVATSRQAAFEFDNVAYSSSPAPGLPLSEVPEPATLAIWGLGLGIAGLVRLRRKS